jgi:hypothetical protein
MIRLIILRTDGEPVSGVYHWAVALGHLRFAATLPNFKDFTLEALC